jgi:hypothetical protein
MLPGNKGLWPVMIIFLDLSVDILMYISLG